MTHVEIEQQTETNIHAHRICAHTHANSVATELLQILEFRNETTFYFKFWPPSLPTKLCYAMLVSLKQQQQQQQQKSLYNIFVDSRLLAQRCKVKLKTFFRKIFPKTIGLVLMLGGLGWKRLRRDGKETYSLLTTRVETVDSVEKIFPRSSIIGEGSVWLWATNEANYV